MNSIIRKTITTILALLCVFPAFALTYVIDSYEISIKGRTQESAIRRYIAYDEGRVFQSQDKIEEAIEEKRQTLLNLRIFKDVTASWKAGAEVDGMIPITLRFNIDGAFSFIAFPSAAYDSNYGFYTQFYVEDQNFLGTTGKTKFSISLKENDNVHDLKHSTFSSYIQFELPIGRDWNMNSGLFMDLRGDDNEKSQICADLTLGTRLFESGSFSNNFRLITNPQSKKRSGLRMIVGFTETAHLAFNENFSADLKNITSFTDDSIERTNTLTTLTASYNLRKLTDLNLTAALTLEEYTWGSTLDTPTLYLKLLSQDYRIKWNGDFRSGYNYSLEAYMNSRFRTLFKGDIRLYKTVFNWLEMSTRLVFSHDGTIDKNNTNRFTKHIRGIIDNNPVIYNQEIHNVAVLNLDTKFHVLTIPNLVKGYAGPFLDFGYVGPDRFLASVGIELVGILDEWPGAPGRVSIGKSLTDPYEYEVTVYAFFFY